MTTELFYLLFTVLLTAVLWIPVVTGYVLARGPLKPSDYKVAPTSPLPHWVNRANRAHVNAVENFVGFSYFMARTVLFTVARVAFVVFAIELLWQTL